MKHFCPKCRSEMFKSSGDYVCAVCRQDRLDRDLEENSLIDAIVDVALGVADIASSSDSATTGDSTPWDGGGGEFDGGGANGDF